jgi:SAM-dependent methyltransferase
VLNQVLRYAPVVEAARRASGRRLLEVGSGSRGIARYLEGDWSITACDISFDDYGSDVTGDGAGVKRVVGSVTELPFADGDFDVVVCLDMLEHLPADARARALEELARVAGDRLIVGCPIGEPARRVDSRVGRFYTALRQPIPPWLSEHLDLGGAPLPRELVGPLTGHGNLQVVANGNATAQYLMLASEAVPVLRRLPLLLSAVLERRMHAGRPATRLMRVLRGGDRGDVYRLVAVLTVDRSA